MIYATRTWPIQQLHHRLLPFWRLDPGALAARLKRPGAHRLRRSFWLLVRGFRLTDYATSYADLADRGIWISHGYRPLCYCNWRLDNQSHKWRHPLFSLRDLDRLAAKSLLAFGGYVAQRHMRYKKHSTISLHVSVKQKMMKAVRH